MKFLSTVALVTLSSLALAVDEFDFAVANVQILADKSVQKEIGLTEGQRSRLNSYADVMNKKTQDKVSEYQKAKKQPDMEFQKFGQETFETFRSNCLNVLSASQLKRLRELTIQAAGPRALMDKVVAKRCGLVEPDYSKFINIIVDGDRKIAKIKGEISQKIQAKYKNSKPKDAAAQKKLYEQIQKDTAAESKKRDAEVIKILKDQDAKIKTVITKAYLTKLTEVAGKPFKPAGANPSTAPKSSAKPTAPTKDTKKKG